MKKLFIVFVVLLVLSSISLEASECDNPPTGTYFCSDWATATEISDGGKWGIEHCEECEIDTTPPAGGPTGNALRVNWGTYAAPDCSAGSDYRVEKTATSPNPFYERFYVYSTNWRAATSTEPVFCDDYKFGRYSGDGCAVTGLYIYSGYGGGAPSGPYYVTVKNHSPEPLLEYTMCHRRNEKLNGWCDWPGKQSNGTLTANTWHSIELGVYRHDTAGWIKLWVDGLLVVNASGAAFSASTDMVVSTGGSGIYDTLKTGGCIEEFLQLPGFRNGGDNPAHTEYFKNVILSSAPIGLVDSGTTPSSAKGLIMKGATWR